MSLGKHACCINNVPWLFYGGCCLVLFGFGVVSFSLFWGWFVSEFRGFFFYCLRMFFCSSISLPFLASSRESVTLHLLESSSKRDRYFSSDFISLLLAYSGLISNLVWKHDSIAEWDLAALLDVLWYSLMARRSKGQLQNQKVNCRFQFYIWLPHSDVIRHLYLVSLTYNVFSLWMCL